MRETVSVTASMRLINPMHCRWRPPRPPFVRARRDLDKGDQASLVRKDLNECESIVGFERHVAVYRDGSELGVDVVRHSYFL
jgi:hypothetical protein